MPTPYTQRQFIADQLREGAPGFEWDAAGIDRADELAGMMLRVGITDLSKLQLVPVDIVSQPFSWWAPDEFPATERAFAFKYGNRYIGYLGEADNVRVEPIFQYDNGKYRLAWSAEGHGNVSYFVVPKGRGQFAIAPLWGSSSDLPDIRTAFTVAALVMMTIVLPAGGIQIAQALGQSILAPVFGTVSPAIAGAVGQVAISTAFNGGDVEAAVKGSVRNLAASAAGAAVGAEIADATNVEVIGRIGGAATSALVSGRDVERAVGETLLRSAPDLIDNAGNSPTYTPPRDSIMSSPFDSDFGEVNPADDPVLTVDSGGWGGENFGNLWGDPQSAPVPEPGDAWGGEGAGNIWGGSDPATPDVESYPENWGGEGSGNIWDTPSDTTPETYPEPAIWGGENRGNIWGSSTDSNGNPVTVQPPVSATDRYGSTPREVINTVSAAAGAALALVRLSDAVRGPQGPVVNTTSRATVTNPNGTRSIVTALDSGVIQRQNQDGTVTNTRPPAGVPQTTVDGNIIVNNGDGTYTRITPNGTRTVHAYDPSLSQDSFMDKIKAIPIPVWIGLAGLAFTALK